MNRLGDCATRCKLLSIHVNVVEREPKFTNKVLGEEMPLMRVEFISCSLPPLWDPLHTFTSRAPSRVFKANHWVGKESLFGVTQRGWVSCTRRMHPFHFRSIFKAAIGIEGWCIRVRHSGGYRQTRWGRKKARKKASIHRSWVCIFEERQKWSLPMYLNSTDW